MCDPFRDSVRPTRAGWGALQVREGGFSRTGCFGVFFKLGVGRIFAKEKKFLSLTLSEIAVRPTRRGRSHFPDSLFRGLFLVRGRYDFSN